LLFGGSAQQRVIRDLLCDVFVPFASDISVFTVVTVRSQPHITHRGIFSF